MSERLRAFVRNDHASLRDVAILALAMSGVDVVPLLTESDAYLVARAEARLDYDPSQPRAANGEWGAGGAPAVKSPQHLAHAKAARESAKEAVGHVKTIRAAYKKEALNEELGKKLQAAENAAKAARSSARKAEAATTESEAAKHAAKAAEHAAKAKGHAETIGEVSGTAKPEAPSVKTTSPGAKPLADKSVASKEVLHKFTKLQEGASKPPPSGWSQGKHDAMASAKKALADHPIHEGMSPDEMKSAADAFDAVAKQASDAGSYWGHDYSALASQLREAATPKEHFEVPGAHDGVKTHVPETSARPIDGIHGEEVPLSTFKSHRDKFTASLNSAEKAAALKYSGSAYHQINGDLRKGKAPDKTVHDLDSAIAKSPAPRDMVVHRGMSGDFVHELFSDFKPGDQFVEKGYTSTSAGGHAAFPGNVKMVITIPKGYPVAPIPSHHASENEYLVRRNTKYQVTKIEKNSKGTITAHVTVVHDELPSGETAKTSPKLETPKSEKAPEMASGQDEVHASEKAKTEAQHLSNKAGTETELAKMEGTTSAHEKAAAAHTAAAKAHEALGHAEADYYHTTAAHYHKQQNNVQAAKFAKYAMSSAKHGN